MTTSDHGVLVGLRWHTHHEYADRGAVHTHSHAEDPPNHRHGDCRLLWQNQSAARLVSARDGRRLAGEVTPAEVMLAAVLGPPTDDELASARSRLDDLLSRLGHAVVAPPACSCSCHVFGGSHVAACC